MAVKKASKAVAKGAKLGSPSDIPGVFKHDGDLTIRNDSTGIYSVDSLLEGGIPRGSIAELFGKSGGGKSCVALQIVGSVQAQGGVAVYADLEQGFDPRKAANSGVNLKELHFIEPAAGEKIFDAVEQLIIFGVDLIVIDSVAAIRTEAQLAGDYGDSHMAQVARLMSDSLPKLIKAMFDHGNKTTVIFINQIRDNIQKMPGYGPTTTTTGGKGLPFYASTRLEVTKVEAIKAGEKVIGQKVKVYSTKTRFSPPFQSTTFDLFYDVNIGVSNESAVIDDAIKQGIFKQSASWITNTLTGENLQGKMKWIEALRDDPEGLEAVMAALKGEPLDNDEDT